MKTSILTLFLSLSVAALSAQTYGTNFKGTTIEGENVELNQWLSEGKTVIVDAMAVWCPPCWSWHQGGILDDVEEMYGENGTDELRVIMIEADGSTDESWLRGGGNSLGDWVEGTKFPILDDPTFGAAYGLTAYPTIYAIYPDRSYEKVGRLNTPQAYQTIAQNAPTPTEAVELIQLPYAGESTFCNDAQLEVEVVNFGTTEITEVQYEVADNSEVFASGSLSVSLESGDFENLIIPALTKAQLSGGTVRPYIRVTVPSDANTNNNEERLRLRPAKEAETESIFIKVVTDNWPIESSWKLFNGNGEIVASEEYSGNATGGGVDAQTTFDYTVSVEGSADCYTFEFYDTYGDGLVFEAGATDIPGFSISDDEGNILVRLGLSGTGAAFGSLAADRIFVGSEFSSSTVDPVGQNLQASPNPVRAGGVLNVSLETGADQLVGARLMNMQGQVVVNYNTELLGGNVNTAYAIPSELPTGLYVLLLQSGDKLSTIKLTVN